VLQAPYGDGSGVGGDTRGVATIYVIFATVVLPGIADEGESAGAAAGVIVSGTEVETAPLTPGIATDPPEVGEIGAPDAV